MKLKNINFFERHIEKFVILIALCVLGYSLYNWGLSTPYKVTLNNQEVTASRVDEVVADATTRLEQVISPDEKEVHPALDSLKVGGIVVQMDKQTRRPLIHQPGDPEKPKYELVDALGGRGPGLDGPTIVIEDPYYEPVVPAPAIAASRATLRTIHPDEFLNNPDIGNQFVNEQKPDLAEITIAAEFDMLEMINQLTFQPEGDILAIPEDWWLTSFELPVVEMWRRHQKADGSWSEPVLVKAIPGSALTEAQRIPDKIDPEKFGAQLPEVLKWIQANRGSILQPPFLETIGEPWSVPRELTPEEIERAGEAGKIKIKIKGLQTQLDIRIKQIQKLQNFGKGRTGGDGIPETGSPGLPGGIPGEIGGERPTRPTRPGRPAGGAGAAARQKQIERWQKLAQKTQDEIAELEAEYKALTGEVIEREQPNRLNPGFPGGEPGFDEFGPEGFPGGVDPRNGSSLDPRTRGFNPGDGRRVPGAGLPGGGFENEFGQPNTRGNRPAAPGGLLDGRGRGEVDGQAPAADTPADRAKRLAIAMGGEKIDIWQADIDVKPGMTYQYRFVVKVTNPLYAKPQLPGKLDDPDKQRARHHDKFLISSKPSEWSKSVTVPQMTRAYAIGATPNPKPGQVTFRVHRFSWGEWRSQEFIVRPGDPIGEEVLLPDANVNVDFRTDWYCLDIDFEFSVKQGALVNRKVPRAIIVQGPDVKTRRVDEDQKAEKEWETNRALDGEFALNN